MATPESSRARRFSLPDLANDRADEAITAFLTGPSRRRGRPGGGAGGPAPIAHAIHRGIRETDFVTRTAGARFQILLPETSASEAAHVADRVVADCDVWLQAIGAP